MTRFGFTSLNRSGLFLLVTDYRIMMSGNVSLLPILLQMGMIGEIKVSLTFFVFVICLHFITYVDTCNKHITYT